MASHSVRLPNPSGRSLSALAVLLAALVAIWLFPLIPAVLRSPVRILTLAGVGIILWQTVSAARQARRSGQWWPFALLTGASVAAAAFLLAGGPSLRLKLNQMLGRMAVPSTSASAGRITELAGELEKRGIRLVAVALPQYGDIFPGSRDTGELAAAMEMVAARLALARAAESADILTGDFGPLFQVHARDAAVWEDDRHHLTADGIDLLAGPVGDYLASLGFPAAGDAGKVVLMGNCFAGQFADALREARPGVWGNLEALSARGDQGRVPETLFLFPDRYLRDTHTVIWLIPYGTLIKSKLPALNAAPNLGEGEARALPVTLRIETALGWDADSVRPRLVTMPYPNGLITITGRIMEDAPGFAKGEIVAALGYGMKDRELTSLGRLAAGKVIDVNLVSLAKYLSRDPKAATEYRLNDAFEGPEPGYWVHSWVLAK